MSGTKKIVERYQMLLTQLSNSDPDETQTLILEANDAMLDLQLAQLEYDTYKETSRFTDDELMNINEAKELRQQIYEKMEKESDTKS